jgi:hypothetical protein
MKDLIEFSKQENEIQVEAISLLPSGSEKDLGNATRKATQNSRDRILKATEERKRLEAEAWKKQREESERLERERIKAEREEKERAEKERLEQQRIAREKALQERKEQERLAQEKYEKEKAEKERLRKEQQEKDRIERKRKEAAHKEQQRLAREKFEADRRNIDEFIRAYLIGKRYQEEKRDHGNTRESIKSRVKGNSFLSLDEIPTAQKISEQSKVSDRTVKNNAAFAEAVDSIERKVGSIDSNVCFVSSFSTIGLSEF